MLLPPLLQLVQQELTVGSSHVTATPADVGASIVTSPGHVKLRLDDTVTVKLHVANDPHASCTVYPML